MSIKTHAAASAHAMMPTRRAVLFAATLSAGLLGSARADGRLRIGTLKFGSVNWVLDTILVEGLDAKEGAGFERIELASNQGLAVALQSGDVDLIVSDWLWAMRQRSEAEPLLFAPYSRALGAVMAPAGGITVLADLKGRRIGVAGSALDKSWLLLRAHAREAVGGDLAVLAEPVYGAPPLLSEQIRLGRIDAVLTYWNFAARLDAAGLRRIVDMVDVVTSLGARPSPPLIGFVWRATLSGPKAATLTRFFRAVTAANTVLAQSDAAWERLRPAMRAETEVEFTRLRDYFRAGIPLQWDEAHTRAAERLFDILRQLGGAALLGERTRFDAALFNRAAG
jgi:NitT/TauT family transport system substrate-binding protein